jgi:GNAT superfamily N-acetyltransferase
MSTSIMIRAAGRDDAADLARLLEILGYPTAPEEALRRLGRLENTGLDQVLVAEGPGALVGLLALHITPVLLHEPGPVGRITALVVDPAHQRSGVGAQLLGAAEQLLRKAGCALVEVSSNNRRADAHAFYLGRGYQQSHGLFRKEL